jgi:Bacterial TSP3 repeat
MKIYALLVAATSFLPVGHAVSQTFAEWRVLKFPGIDFANDAVSRESADPDGDGLANFAEFALDSDPLTPDANAGFAASMDAEGKLTLQFARLKTHPGVLYIPQLSGDLTSPWRSGVNYFETLAVTERDAASEWVTVRDRNPPDMLTRRFIRLLLATDQDGDGLPDEWELHSGLDMFNPYDGGSDLDDDGFTAAQEFANGTDPLIKPVPPPAQTIPAPPTNVKYVKFEDGSRYYWWDDNSDNEAYFVVREHRSDGTTVELGRTGPGATSIFIPAPR